jgi:hypothetical protein
LQVKLDKSIDPYSPRGLQWLEDMRLAMAVLEASEAYEGWEFHVQGGPGNTLDAVKVVFNAFPVIVGLTVLLVALIVGFAFQSVLLPLRTVLSIGMTIIFVYGLAYVVYVRGWWDNALGGHGLDGLQSEIDRKGIAAVNWFSPIICFSILVGLNLDNDMFLISRVLEYRMLGYSTKEATLRAVHTTGGIIIGTGLIMTLSFSGLLFSSSPSLNQTAFFLVFNVLIDTFFIRILVVPALVGLGGEQNWWPRRTRHIATDRDSMRNSMERHGGNRFSMAASAGSPVVNTLSGFLYAHNNEENYQARVFSHSWLPGMNSTAGGNGDGAGYDESGRSGSQPLLQGLVDEAGESESESDGPGGGYGEDITLGDGGKGKPDLVMLHVKGVPRQSEDGGEASTRGVF